MTCRSLAGPLLFKGGNRGSLPCLPSHDPVCLEVMSPRCAGCHQGMPDPRESSPKMRKMTRCQPPPDSRSSCPEPAATPGGKHGRAARPALKAALTVLSRTGNPLGTCLYIYSHSWIRVPQLHRALASYPSGWHVCQVKSCAWAVSAVASLSSIPRPWLGECSLQGLVLRGIERSVSPVCLASPFSVRVELLERTQEVGREAVFREPALSSCSRLTFEIPGRPPRGHVFPFFRQLPGLNVTLVLPESSEQEAVSLTPSSHRPKGGPQMGTRPLSKGGRLAASQGRGWASFGKTAKGKAVDILKSCKISRYKSNRCMGFI